MRICLIRKLDLMKMLIIISLSFISAVTTISTTTTNESATESFDLPSSTAVAEVTTLEHPYELEKVLPQNGQLMSVKIRNKQGEVIAKWLEKGVFVTPKTPQFLQKASSGSYEIEVLLIDGTEKLFHFVKKQ